MSTTRSLFNAVAVGALAGSLSALWATAADAQASTVPGMAGPVTPVPGQAGPVTPVPGQAGPAQQVPGQSGPAPRASAPVRVPDQPAPQGAYATLPRCDGGDCADAGPPASAADAGPAQDAR